jgi:hypothetical protein|tara:strand:- start:266 stop:469 length:204 start_codon:yes stop_codon:yes gene_type:complete
MAEKSAIPLPVAPQEYSNIDQSILRSTLEGTIVDINSDIGGANQMKNKISSLSVRRHQFLLMGASGG